MTFFSFTDKSLTRYLLGECSARKREKIESGYLSDDQLHARLLLAEENLIEAYLDGSLSPSQRKSFERWFLASPERRDKLEFVRTMTKISQTVPPGTASMRRRQWLRSAVVGVSMLVLVVLVLWLPRSGPELEPDAMGHSKSAIAGKKSAPILSFVLAPATRSLDDSGNTVTIPDGKATIRLLLRVAERPESDCRATIHPVDGGPDITASAATPSEHELAVDLPASALAAGDYEIFFEQRAVHGKWRSAGGAAFRVVRVSKK